MCLRKAVFGEKIQIGNSEIKWQPGKKELRDDSDKDERRSEIKANFECKARYRIKIYFYPCYSTSKDISFREALESRILN